MLLLHALHVIGIFALCWDAGAAFAGLLFLRECAPYASFIHSSIRPCVLSFSPCVLNCGISHVCWFCFFTRRKITFITSKADLAMVLDRTKDAELNKITVFPPLGAFIPCLPLLS